MGPELLLPGVLVILAYFTLIAFIVWVLRPQNKEQPSPLVKVIVALAVAMGALPPIIYGLYWAYEVFQV
ncbi:hypothetical protein ETD83_40925 [Actinomadura soli]|uniref:Uncharacterized protein n=1 Tax=Actinomadura soli TaxID=2508997 RepID=A0A5C4IZJ3_9ACTN|nr:hypothetical protein [Actinomadura soli]TMQ84305.1 hypothetical protein ETD83_40925 [Actinomadura soli]